jgi:hypothetical protein
MQSLKKFRVLEGVYFDYASLSQFLILENQNPQTGRGPLISAHSNHAQAVVQTAAAATGCRHPPLCRSPTCHGRSYCRAWAGRELLSLFASSSQSPSALLSLLSHRRLALPPSGTVNLPLYHPTVPREAPQHLVPPAPSSRPGRWLPKPSNRDSHAVVFLRKFYRHRPPPVNLRPSLHPSSFADL